jgi:hypothetical protein
MTEVAHTGALFVGDAVAGANPSTPQPCHSALNFIHIFSPFHHPTHLSTISMAATKIPVPKPGEGEPIVFFDIQLGGKCSLFYISEVQVPGEKNSVGLGRVKRIQRQNKATISLPCHARILLHKTPPYPLSVAALPLAILSHSTSSLPTYIRRF